MFSDHNEIKLEIDGRKITGKPPNTWKLRCFWIIHGSKIKSQGKFKNYIELTENENTTYQNLWDTKTMLRGKFIALNAYIRKEGNSQNNNQSSHLRNLEKE